MKRDVNEILRLMYENINLMRYCFKDLIGMMYAKKIITGLESLDIDNYLDNHLPYESEVNSTWNHNDRLNWLKKQLNPEIETNPDADDDEYGCLFCGS